MFGAVFLKDNVENIFNAFGICDKIFKPVLTVNDLGISYRTINNWEANGLMLSERKNSRDWHKFSFVDFIWLNIVFELRQLGFPLTKIKLLKAFLNENIDDDSLRAVKRTEARIILSSKNLNRLVLLLAEIMYNKNHIALLCNKDGSFYIYNEQMVKDELEIIDVAKLQFTNFVSVSLTDIIIRYLTGCSLQIIEDSRLIDDSFFNMISRLRSKELPQVVFRTDEVQTLLLQDAMFRNYGEYCCAAIRLMLTLKCTEIAAEASIIES